MATLVNYDRLRLFTTIFCTVLSSLCITTAQALDSGTPRITTYNGWQAFEVITQGDDVPGDGYSYSMPGTFDGAGAWFSDGTTLRVQVNHETSDASISEVDLDLANLQVAINNMIVAGNTGGVSFVLSARQAYSRWSSDGGVSFTNTSSASNTNFSQFCSSQAYAADTFGQDRGFVDPLYITGEEVSGGRLFALDSVARDLYQLSGTIGSASGGIGGMSYDAWENAALLDTGETAHVALLLSPDGGSQSMKLYIGVKGKDVKGNTSNSFLARNGLAYGSWYYLNGSLPGNLGATNDGTFDTSSSGALVSTKLEDIDTSPSNPTQAVLGDQDSGVFRFNFDLVFTGGFDAGASSFTVTKISNEGGSDGSLDSPDNIDWTAATTLRGTTWPDGLVFVNEDNSSGEIWRMNPYGSNQVRIGQTTVGAESSGIFDLSEFVGYAPGSVLVTNNQGSPSSMTIMINPSATPTSTSCGDDVCDIDEENPLSCPQDCPEACDDGFCTSGEDPLSCPADCPDVCGDGMCSGTEGTTTCPVDCGTECGDGVCNGSEDANSCPGDCLVATPVDLSGTIKTSDNVDICAMVLASGQFMFSCNPVGKFSLTDLPRENDGSVKRQIYADGFFPKVDVLTKSTEEAVVMTRSGTCPNYNTSSNPAFRPDSAGKRINISGKILLQNSQTPLCAMALANGQYMFSCDGTGNYALNIPLDTNGQFKLQVYADGFAPITQKFDESSANNDVRMARAVECQ